MADSSAVVKEGDKETEKTALGPLPQLIKSGSLPMTTLHMADNENSVLDSLNK